MSIVPISDSAFRILKMVSNSPSNPSKAAVFAKKGVQHHRAESTNDGCGKVIVVRPVAARPEILALRGPASKHPSTHTRPGPRGSEREPQARRERPWPGGAPPLGAPRARAHLAGPPTPVNMFFTLADARVSMLSRSLAN